MVSNLSCLLWSLFARLEPTCKRALEGINGLTEAARRMGRSSQAAAAAAAAADTSGPSCHSASVRGPVASANPIASASHDWLQDCEETSNDVLELSSPAIPQEDGESETFSEPFWQDVDGETTN